MKQKSTEITRQKTLVGWLYAIMRETSLWSAAKRAAGYARRFFFVWNLIKWSAIIIAIIETSAVLLIAAAAMLALLPAAAALIIACAAASHVIGTRILSRGLLDDALSREHIIIVGKAGSFGRAFAEAMAEHAAVFVFDSDIRSRFLCIRRRGGVYYIRHAFFFQLKRKRLDALSDRMIYLL